jgi:formate dehydrogenase subunit gamma
LQRSAIAGIDATSGELHYITRPREADWFGELAAWKPVYERREDEVIYPFNNILTIWFANLDVDSVIYPLFAAEHKAAWRLFKKEITDDNDDGVVEINRDEEIIAGLKAVARSLAGNRRFSQIEPVFIKGGKGYQLDKQGQLHLLEMDVKCDMSYSINHNVAKQALGTGGCGDCHFASAHFFKGQRETDLYAADGQPVTRSIGRYLGCNKISFAINSFHQEILSPFVSISLILVIFLVAVHYHSYGPKRVQFIYGSGEIERFTLFDRGIHLFRLLSFLLLTVTGLILAFNLSAWQQLLFASAYQMLWIHIISGFVFILTTFFGIVAWFKDALFASYAREGVKAIGGYLGFKCEVPAARFNAGQKIFYWYSTIFGLIMAISGMILVFKYSFPLSAICVTSTVHNLFGFVMIAGVLAHAYLGTVANPGTWRVLVDGHVTREWAEHHHPNWYRKLIGAKPEADAPEP